MSKIVFDLTIERVSEEWNETSPAGTGGSCSCCCANEDHRHN